MSLKNLNKLEQLITTCVGEIHKLRAEKNQLAQEIRNLKNKMESGKEVVREKVKGMLNDLTKIDFM